MRNEVRRAVKAVTSIRPATRAASVNGSSIDTQGYRSAMVVFSMGALADTATLTFIVEESDASGSGFAAISGATKTVTVSGGGAEDNTDSKFGIMLEARARKRYIRAVGTYGGSGNVDFGAIVLLGDRFKTLSDTDQGDMDVSV